MPNLLGRRRATRHQLRQMRQQVIAAPLLELLRQLAASSPRHKPPANRRRSRTAASPRTPSPAARPLPSDDRATASCENGSSTQPSRPHRRPLHLLPRVARHRRTTPSRGVADEASTGSVCDCPPASGSARRLPGDSTDSAAPFTSEIETSGLALRQRERAGDSRRSAGDGQPPRRAAARPQRPAYVRPTIRPATAQRHIHAQTQPARLGLRIASPSSSIAGDRNRRFTSPFAGYPTPADTQTPAPRRQCHRPSSAPVRARSPASRPRRQTTTSAPSARRIGRMSEALPQLRKSLRLQAQTRKSAQQRNQPKTARYEVPFSMHR